jgi:hypothetical protein
MDKNIITLFQLTIIMGLEPVLFKNILVLFNVSNKAHIKIHRNYSNKCEIA